MTKDIMLSMLQRVKEAWERGDYSAAYNDMFNLCGVVDPGVYPKYAGLELGISRLLAQVGVNNKSAAAAMWTAGKTLAEGEANAYQMGLINICTAIELINQSGKN